MPVKKVEKKEKVVKKAKTIKPKAEKAVKVAKVAKKEVKKEKVIAEVAPEKIIKEIKAEKVVPIKAVKKITEKYFYAVGRRKTSVAQVRLFENDNATDDDLVVNGKKFKEYFPSVSAQNNFLSPLKTVGMQGKVSMTIIVNGGGVTGQVDAARLGVARALVKFDETLKKTLKDIGLMTRDSRKVERKKPGLKKARKAPQWSKR
jgi:small subunit ribosomal protein S9